jgi:hypothetical protein
MSELRNQLQSVKADYESARYPGDLAADVMPAELQLHTAARAGWHNRWRIMAAASLLTGAAAAAVVVWIAHPAGQVTPARMPVSSPPVVARVPHDQPQPAQQLQQPNQDQPSDEVAQADDEDRGLFESISDLAPPALPENMPMAPSADMFELGSMPTIPSIVPTFPDTDTVSPNSQEHS